MSESARSHAVRAELIERSLPAVRAGPSLAVGFVLGIVVWFALAGTSWVGLRYFLTSLVIVVVGVVLHLFRLKRVRPDRSAVRPLDLTVRFEVDAAGAHLVEDQGPRETVAWTAPHALQVWSDGSGRPLLARLTDGQVVWTLVGGLGERAPDGESAQVLPAAAVDELSVEKLTQRHAPWELIVRIAEGSDLLSRLAAVRGDRAAAAAWRIPLDAEWDPTARWSLRIRRDRLDLEREGVSEVAVALREPFEQVVTPLDVTIPGEEAHRRLRRFDLRQGTATIRFTIDPALLPETRYRDDGTPTATSDQPRLVPAEWAPLVLATLGRR